MPSPPIPHVYVPSQHPSQHPFFNLSPFFTASDASTVSNSSTASNSSNSSNAMPPLTHVASHPAASDGASAYIIAVSGGSKAEKNKMTEAMRRAGPMIRKAKIERMMNDPVYRAQRTMKRDDGGLEFMGPQEWMMTEEEARDFFADGTAEELEEAVGKLEVEDERAKDDYVVNDETEDEQHSGGVYLGDINGEVNYGHIHYAKGTITKTVEIPTQMSSKTSPI